MSDFITEQCPSKMGAQTKLLGKDLEVDSECLVAHAEWMQPLTVLLD